MLNLGNFVHQFLCQTLCIAVISAEIVGGIDKSLIDGVDMDIIGGEILEVDRIDIRCIVDIQLHPRQGNLILYVVWYFI